LTFLLVAYALKNPIIAVFRNYSIVAENTFFCSYIKDAAKIYKPINYIHIQPHFCPHRLNSQFSILNAQLFQLPFLPFVAYRWRGRYHRRLAFAVYYH
jgi:hypothetical protein